MVKRIRSPKLPISDKTEAEYWFEVYSAFEPEASTVMWEEDVVPIPRPGSITTIGGHRHIVLEVKGIGNDRVVVRSSALPF